MPDLFPLFTTNLLENFLNLNLQKITSEKKDGELESDETA